MAHSIEGFQMSIKHPTSGQVRAQEAAQEAAVQQIFHLVRSNFFIFQH